MNKLKFYYYTLINLEFIQIKYRIIYIFKRKLYERIGEFIQKRYFNQYTNSSIQINLNKIMLFNNRNYYYYNLDGILNNKITFLNRTIDFGPQIQWNKEELNYGTKLWKLNLHYHEFLFDIALKYEESSEKKYLIYLENTINIWINENPIGTEGYGGDNWNSYCISLRVVVWIKIYILLEEVLHSTFKKRFLELLWVQGAFLYDNLELDILGNHLIKNYKALYYLGDFFSIKKYIKRAEELYVKHISIQFTESGMHEELSPMYSAIILEDLIEVYLITKKEFLKELIQKQYQCLEYIIGKDDKFTYFNDSVNKNGIEFIQLKSLYKKVFPDAKIKENALLFDFDGYIGFENEYEKIIFDAGEIVKGNQPGHGHCDALSFEYFIGKNKLFTNSGVFEYNKGERRNYSRSTKAHNTLCFNKLEQSEIWSSFRMARRAKVGYNIEYLTPYSLKLTGFVEGFDFTQKVMHKRTIIKEDSFLKIVDSVYTKKTIDSEIFFHLMPPFYFKEEDTILFIFMQKKKIAMVDINKKYEILSTPFYPEFGKEVEKSSLCIKHDGNKIDAISIFNFLEKS